MGVARWLTTFAAAAWLASCATGAELDGPSYSGSSDPPETGSPKDASVEASDPGTGGDPNGLDGTGGPSDGEDGAATDEPDAALDADPLSDATSEPPDAAPDAVAPRPTPTFVKLDELCKLITDKNQDSPTANDTHRKYNLRGTDLGIPVAHGSDLYFFFGDTAGNKIIWPLGPESLPDAVGYAGQPGSVAATPNVLCSTLKFLKVDGVSIDKSTEADFAGGAMTPPNGEKIGDYIHNAAGPRGKNAFPSLPGDFEVPSGAFSYAGSIYVFYTTVQVSPLEMKGSYLAKWASPSTSGQPNYDILYKVDQRFDASGALRGDFINIAPLLVGDYVYLYGTGKYRESPVHLARKRLAELADEGGFESYDATAQKWVAGSAPAAPIVSNAKIGELSVQYFPAVGVYAMMDQEIDTSGNYVMARFANAPEGPFSAPIPVAKMEDPLFAAAYCCINGDCSGKRLFNCGDAGFYGTYMLPEPIVNADGSFTITFTMSTWKPYNVALMQATFR